MVCLHAAVGKSADAHVPHIEHEFRALRGARGFHCYRAGYGRLSLYCEAVDSFVVGEVYAPAQRQARAARLKRDSLPVYAVGG